MRKSNGMVKEIMINKMSWLNHILKKLWITLAILIILAAVFSSLFRSLTPFATQYKKEVEYHLTELIGQPVTIQSMQTGWYWFHPVLKLNHLSIRGAHDNIHVEQLSVGINLFKSLIHWHIQPGILYLDKLHLVAREKDGQWQIDGINPATDNSNKAEKIYQLIQSLAQQDRLIIKNFSMVLHADDGTIIPIKNLNISIVNRSGRYKIKGQAILDQRSHSSFELLGDLSFDPYHFKDTAGHLYFSAKNVLPAQWQNLFPTQKIHLESGLGDLKLWLDLYDGSVSSALAQVKFKELAWQIPPDKNRQLIQSFYVNLAWKPDDKGWQFQADKIKLQMGDIKWPENQVLIRYDETQQSYSFFIKSIVVESLLAKTIAWPDALNSIVNLNPYGLLTDFQVIVKNNKPSYLLTRFDKLGWSAQNNLPKVNNLSGVIHWEPQEGHLELDSEHTLVEMKGYPKQNLTLLNGAIDWKELNNGLRVSIERFVLSQPELTVTLQGVIDEVSRTSVGNIRLALDFSAKNIQQWMAYLPKERMKPKLFFWLNNDVKRIAEATGKVTINGLAKDFPFDNHNGEFSVISHASGGELFITPKWQLIKDLEGYVRLKNRNLEVDLVNGDFQGVPVKQMNLRIDDIGKDKETLLIHGIVNGQAQKMLNFILASPLKEKLIKLKMLALKGLLLLDVHLEIPLYPENDDNLVKGDVVFKDNSISVKHHMGTFPIEEVSGRLSFDETGVTHSALVATAFGYPLNIKIQSIKKPNPATNLFINGECTVESLKSRFKLPFLDLLKGMFSVNAVFKITPDPNDLDNMVLNTSLEGLAINLPEPLGKTYKEKSPLKINLDFNAEKAVRLRADYNNRLSTDILFEHNKKSGFELKSGQISLGGAPALDQKKAGLAVVGSLDGFDLQKWNKIFTRFSPNNSSELFDKLRYIDVKLNKLVVLQQRFDHLSIKGTILSNRDWAINLAQKKFAADLTYKDSNKQLSGYVKYLHLDKLNVAKLNGGTASQIKPEQIPNLNLRIDDFSVGNTLIGNITLKSHSSPGRWAIDYCHIESPVYQFIVAGEWLQKGNDAHTNLQVKLHVNNLAKSLERWNFTPAVDASKGYLEFDGRWNGGLINFSLAGLKGSVYLQLKNGRITHLSPETEEKLGLGKLLSVLSLQTIPRRLKLDFSDLSHQGYSFDIFKGNFDLNKGIMNTQNSYIDGPVAYASMKGDLDILKKMYDLDLSISPHITASLPVVATIAGGPIAGLAAWVANKIINQSMQKITGYSYKISGPWDQPVVQQMSIVKKIIKK